LLHSFPTRRSSDLFLKKPQDFIIRIISDFLPHEKEIDFFEEVKAIDFFEAIQLVDFHL
jgi:hypothetical protein